METTVTRHPYPRTGTFQAGGIPFTVLTDDETLADQIAWVLRDLETPPHPVGEVVFELQRRTDTCAEPSWIVSRDGVVRHTAVAGWYVLPYLLLQVTRLTFRAPDRVPLHAAALAHGDRAVVIAGITGAGKSTLAGWLVHRGWGFLTDEAALVDPSTLVVHPFWRPIGVRTPGPLDPLIDRALAVDEHEVLVPASAIGRLARSAPLAAVVFPHRESGASGSLTAVRRSTALAELAEHYPDLSRQGRAGFHELAVIAKHVPAYRLRYHDLNDAERELRTLLVQ